MKQTLLCGVDLGGTKLSVGLVRPKGMFLFGAGSAYDTMIFLTVSTGIGTGLVLNRRIFRGMTGTAGEFGHTIVNPHSDIRCGCGNYGCLMSHASGIPDRDKADLEGRGVRIYIV